MRYVTLGRVPRNARTVYYANAVENQERNGKPVRIVVAEAQAVSFKAVRRWLDEQGMPGDVTAWSERTQQQDAVAERKADGTWLVRDPFTGWVPLAGQEG